MSVVLQSYLDQCTVGTQIPKNRLLQVLLGVGGTVLLGAGESSFQMSFNFLIPTLHYFPPLAIKTMIKTENKMFDEI